MEGQTKLSREEKLRLGVAALRGVAAGAGHALVTWIIQLLDGDWLFRKL